MTELVWSLADFLHSLTPEAITAGLLFAAVIILIKRNKVEK